MKKTIWLAICLLMTGIVFAQTQQGYVKTKGRMVNGQLVPGKGIQNAVVVVHGRSTVLSQSNGNFSFSMPAQTFKLDSVSRKGFQLVDADALTKPYKYSTNPLYLVMDTPEQQQADLLAKERKLRRDLQHRLQEREDEVEDLNVSLEEKNRLLEEINKERDDNEKIVKELSKYYATLDYDQLDDFQRTVTDLLENGQLEQADSMLRSRGDMRSRVHEINKEQEAEAKEEAELNQRQKDLTASKEGTQKKIELVAADCYNFYQRFLQVHQNDSAAHYLELRAQVDTTNLKWQSEAGQFIREYLADYPHAMSYFQRVLRQSFGHDGAESEWSAQAYHDMGSVYDIQGDYPQALEYYNKALDIRKKVLGEEHLDIAQSYNNIGVIYSKQGKYSNALEYLNKALTIREKASGPEDQKVAAFCHNIGNVSSRLGDYPKALEYLNRALSIREKLFGLEHPDIAMSYNSIGGVYSHQGNDSKALEYLSKALTINEKIFGSKHPIVAASYNNVGYIYSRQGECPKALEYYNKALAIREKLFGPEHPDVAMSYNNIGIIYHKQDDFTKALEYYEQAQAIWEKVYGKEHPSVAKSYNNIGTLYDKQGDYSKALEYYEKALTIYEKVYGKEHPDVASSYSNIGGIYYDRGDYPKALDYLGKALAIYEKVFGLEHPTTKFISDTILSAKYKQALLSGNLSDFLSRHAFTVTVDDGDTPAGQQGMSGEYYLLEFADWTQESGISMYDKTEEMKEKAKDILVLKDGVVSQYHFDDTIGAQYGIKDIGKEERQRINKTYENWKKQNRK